MTRDQVDHLLLELKTGDSDAKVPCLSDLCLQRGLLTREQVEELHLRVEFSLMRERNTALGALVVKRGFASMSEVQEALGEQQRYFASERKLPPPILEILVGMDLLTRQQLQELSGIDSQAPPSGEEQIPFASMPATLARCPACGIGIKSADSHCPLCKAELPRTPNQNATTPSDSTKPVQFVSEALTTTLAVATAHEERPQPADPPSAPQEADQLSPGEQLSRVEQVTSHCLGCGKKLRNVISCPRCPGTFCSEVCVRRHFKATGHNMSGGCLILLAATAVAAASGLAAALLVAAIP